MNNNEKRCSKELEDILDGLADNLTIDDIMYITMKWMENNHVPMVESKGYSPNYGGLDFKFNASLVPTDK